MKDINIKILILFLLLSGLRSNCQMIDFQELTPKQLIKFGKNAAKKGDVHTAIFFYEKYYLKRKNNVKINYSLAELHRKARNYEKAKTLYEKVFKTSPKKYPYAQFYYAQMLKSTGKYEEAAEEFYQFRRNIRGKKDSRDWRRLARYEMNGCDSAIGILKNPLNVSIEHLNSTINGPHIEFSPIPLSDTFFIYGALRVDSLVYFTNENIDTVKPVRQFYAARRKNLDWEGGLPFDTPINVPGIETGNGVISRDGQRFYFTRCFENWQEDIICGIYVSHKKNGKWQEPIKLPASINDPNFTSTQPALGRTAKYNREVIYFVSNRDDGKGGLDIWYAVYDSKKDRYSKVRNLGRRINTSADEMTPYYDLSTRTLYFSSAGHPGIGGLDIFHSIGSRFKWTKAKNIGYPINSSYDDLYFTASKSGEFGFFSTNRPVENDPESSTCCDDLYFYRWNEFIRIGVKGKIYPFEKDKYGRKPDLSNFDFMNPSADVEPLNNAIIALYMEDKESKEYVFMERDTTGKDGMYFFTLLPEQNYEFRMEGFQYFNSKVFLSTEFFTSSDTLEMLPIWVNVLTDKPVVLENIYYEFNSTELNDDAKIVLDTTLLVMLKEAPEFIIEIGSHTDSIGTFEYNQELSQERAQNVVDYLITKGIDPNRLVAKGYGAQQPIAPNYNPDGSDNPDGRQKNRRTEFRVVGTINELVEDEEFEDDF